MATGPTGGGGEREGAGAHGRAGEGAGVYGPLPISPGQSTVLPHSQMSAGRRMERKVLCDESKWLSMRVSEIILSR